MRPLVCGAALGLVWLVVGVPLAPALTALAAVVQPVTVAFLLGAVARPYVRRSGRWSA